MCVEEVQKDHVMLPSRASVDHELLDTASYCLTLRLQNGWLPKVQSCSTCLVSWPEWTRIDQPTAIQKSPI